MPNYRGLKIPFTSFGNVTSDDLFCDKEQELFDFYEQNTERYDCALDIGANIGVHSILMSRAGWFVEAYEPDPTHFEIAKQLIPLNTLLFSGPREPRVWRSAVSDHDGREIFVRVAGNTTGSHLKGDKTPYGETEEFTVTVVDCRPLFEWADFAKIDCEGHEARLIKCLEPGCVPDIMVEVGNPKNACEIYEHVTNLGLKMWAQHRKWRPVEGLGHMPVHHSEGALFIGQNPPFAR